MSTIVKKIYTKSEAAEYLGISEITLERWTQAGEIAVVQMPSTGRVGRPRNMWHVRDLEAFIDKHRTVKPQTTSAPMARAKAPHKPGHKKTNRVKVPMSARDVLNTAKAAKAVRND